MRAGSDAGQNGYDDSEHSYGRLEEHVTNNTESVARSFMASFEVGDPHDVAGHVSDDFVNEHTAALGSGCVSKAAYLERLPGFLADMVGLRYEVEDLIVDGDKAAVFYRMTAQWQGKARFDVRGVQRLTVKDSLITHRVDYWDSAVFLTQASPEARDALRPFGVR